MKLPERVAVVGLGLMGGSLARDLAARGVRVSGHDRDPAVLRAARAEGVLRGDVSASLDGVEAADLLVLATPVDVARSILEAVLPRLRPGCVLTDLGSTKRSIERAAVELGVAERFVGSHPLTGDHRSGWEASRAGLYRGAPVYLCPTPATRAEVLDGVRGMWLELGARPEVLAAAEHDRRLAWTSHLPQAASSALAGVLDGAGLFRADLGPGGRDVTRLAGSSPELWSAICLDNADHLDAAVAGLVDRLDAFRSALRGGDSAALHRFFAAAHAWSQAEPRGA